MKNKDLKPSSLTDWDRVNALNDEDIDTSDAAPLDEEFFARAQLLTPNNSLLMLNISPQAMEKIKVLAKERATTEAAIVSEWVEEKASLAA